jgi:hypothetical protein
VYTHLVEQTQRIFGPLGNIWFLQAEAVQNLAQKQSSMMTEAWTQGVATLQSLSAQKNVEDIFKKQEEYWSGLNDAVIELMEDTQGTLTETNQKIAQLMRESFGDLPTAVAEFMPQQQQVLPLTLPVSMPTKSPEIEQKVEAKVEPKVEPKVSTLREIPSPVAQPTQIAQAANKPAAPKAKTANKSTKPKSH